MKAKFLVAVLITASLASTVARAQSGLPDKPTYSHSELRHLIHTAHSPEQFNALADYFDRKQKEYIQKSAAEKIELDRRLAAPTLSPKYPTPVDTARRLLGYYEATAEEYGHRADEYRLEAKRASAVNSTLEAR
jgi:hypothetical protein